MKVILVDNGLTGPITQTALYVDGKRVFEGRDVTLMCGLDLIKQAGKPISELLHQSFQQSEIESFGGRFPATADEFEDCVISLMAPLDISAIVANVVAAAADGMEGGNRG